MAGEKRNLKELNKAQLIELVELLLARVATLEKRVAQLEAADQKKVPKTSQNSSVAPSQDQKANQAVDPAARRGAKPGHVGRSRERLTPDEIIECRVPCCQNCGTDLSGQAQWVVGRHQVIDIPPIKAVVREAWRYQTTCPQCKSQQTAAYAPGFERGRTLGSHLERWILYLHYAHPLSYERVQRLLAELFGVQISRGALVNLVKRAEKRLQAGAADIRRQLQQATVIGSDETGARVAGVKFWQWVFQTPQWAYYVIASSRAAQVIDDVLEDAQPAVWVSDAFSAQLCHPAPDYQLCLAHQVRDLQYMIDSHACDWAQQVQTLFYDVMRFNHERGRLDANAFARQRAAYETRLDALLALPPDTAASENLRGRFIKHRRALFFFLQRADVPPTNNASEQALRNSVIYRKVTGGFRSEWGAQLYANWISILETARRQERPLFVTLAAILEGQPVFALPDSL